MARQTHSTYGDEVKFTASTLDWLTRSGFISSEIDKDGNAACDCTINLERLIEAIAEAAPGSTPETVIADIAALSSAGGAGATALQSALEAGFVDYVTANPGSTEAQYVDALLTGQSDFQIAYNSYLITNPGATVVEFIQSTDNDTASDLRAAYDTYVLANPGATVADFMRSFDNDVADSFEAAYQAFLITNPGASVGVFVQALAGGASSSGDFQVAFDAYLVANPGASLGDFIQTFDSDPLTDFQVAYNAYVLGNPGASVADYIQSLDSDPADSFQTAYDAYVALNPGATVADYIQSLDNDAPDAFQTAYEAYVALPGNGAATVADYIQSLDNDAADTFEAAYQAYVTANGATTLDEFIDTFSDETPFEVAFGAYLALPGNAGNSVADYVQSLDDDSLSSDAGNIATLGTDGKTFVADAGCCPDIEATVTPGDPLNFAQWIVSTPAAAAVISGA